MSLFLDKEGAMLPQRILFNIIVFLFVKYFPFCLSLFILLSSTNCRGNSNTRIISEPKILLSVRPRY